MRLDQFVSQSTGMSRKEAHRCIRGKHIIVEGAIVRKSSTHVNPDDEVLMDFEPLQLPGNIYIVLNKPAGVVSATEDTSQPTVLGLIDHPHWHTLHIVGRLDKDTTGLILLTNDGEWSHRITSPNHHVDKTYLAQLDEPLSAEDITQLEEGVMMKGEKQPTRPAKVEVLEDNWVRLTIQEGKYHQVKRMFATVDNHVISLHRERVGQWVLPDDLEEGDGCLLEDHAF
uniref:Pseudouridine synthase n=1 Tax=uncultured Thiotrichaceae bacterium TaxID=298394 RepID=A0A6S6TY84_9GAMM|nr:MAG: Ribosomal small subunit pseudouridine synthase A (EC [uncultured Thiotrichaceae bacterium]